MAIWSYAETSDSVELIDLYGRECRFCKSRMAAKDVRYSWRDMPVDVIAQHRATIISMAEIHGEFILREFDHLNESEQEYTHCHCCPACGWWLVAKKIRIHTKGQLWESYYGASGILAKPIAKDLNEPIREIRRYLVAKYQQRFLLHPRQMEEVVSSIFSSLGYQTFLTSYTGDGGIDVILHDSSGVIGVQVKRYKNSIDIEQIRSFLGALLLKGYTRGVFVTTSRFQSGANALLAQAANHCIQLELVDAEKLFELLKLVQIKEFDRYPEFPLWVSGMPLPKLQFVDELNLNSL